MPGREIDANLAGLCRAYGVDRVHAEFVAGLCESIFLRTRHLHGLTKTWFPMVRAAGLLHDLTAGSGKTDHHLRAARIIARGPIEGLPPLHRRVVADAVSLHASGSDVRGFVRTLGGGPGGAGRGVSARIAAILRVADGLDHTATQETVLVGIRDDGQALDVLLSPSPGAAENAARAAAKSDLWNLLALRPIRMVGVAADRSVPRGATMRPGENAVDAARKVCQLHLEHLISREFAADWPEDIECVHEMRVATRRLRSAMRIFARRVRGRFEAPRERLKALADVLGAARDADVFAEFIDDYVAEAPSAHARFLDGLRRAERRKRRERCRRVGDVVRGRQYVNFTRALHRALRRPVDSAGGVGRAGRRARTVADEARRALRACVDKLREFDRRLERLPVEQQHALRIACKRMRYTAEFFREIYPPELERVISSMVRMQDLLGEAHDADAYAERVRQYAAGRRLRTPDPDAGAAMERLLGELGSRQQALVRKARSTWMQWTGRRVAGQVLACIDSPLRA